MKLAVLLVCLVACLAVVSSTTDVRPATPGNVDADCFVCKFVATEIERLLEQGKAEDEIEAAVSRKCATLPVPLRPRCEIMVEQYTRFIIQLLLDEETPDTICHQIGFCTEAVASRDTWECSLCVFVMTEVEKIIAENRTEEAIEAALEKVCAVLPSQLRDICKTMVDDYLPMLIELFEQKEPPKKICQQISFCSSVGVVKVKGDMECSLCELVIDEVEKLLADNRTVEKIEEALDVVCDVLPAMLRGACEALVKKYTPALIDLLEKKETPAVICKQIGFCKAAANDPIGCALCKLVIQEIYKLLEGNYTEEKIIQVLQTVCNVVPGSLRDICKQMIAQYTPALIKYLEQKLSPEVICRDIGFCSSTTATPKAAVVRMKDPVGCAICKLVMEEVYKLLAGNFTEEKIEEALDVVCDVLPSAIRGICESLVAQYVPELIQMLEQKFSPEVICKSLGVCSANGANDPIQCALCELVIDEVYKILAGNYTEQKIIEALETVCSYLPRVLQPPCKQFIEDFTVDLIHLLEQHLPAADVCKAIGLCPKTSAMIAASAPHVGDTVQCTMCKLAMTEVEKILADSRTEEKIEEALDVVCDRLPAALRKPCEDLVATYLPVLIQLFEKKETPEVICKQVGYCSTASNVAVVSDTVECSLCKFVMTEVEKLLKDNYTEKKIEEVLDVVCDVLPSVIRKPCEALVEQYLPALIDLLEKKETPDVICKQIGVCKSAVSVVSDTVECSLCKFVMTEVEKVLADNYTEEKIEEALDLVCDMLPSAVRDPCKALIALYLPELIELLEKKETPDVICKQIGLCTSSRSDDSRTTCAVCELIMVMLDAAIQEHATEEELIRLLTGVCFVVPLRMKEDCVALVEVFGPELLKMIAQMPYDRVCSALGLCPGA